MNPRSLAILVGLAAATALLGGCLGESEPDAASLPSLTFTLESGFSDATGFHWKAIGGDLDGQINPVLVVPRGFAVEVRIIHGADAADTAPHNLRIAQEGTTLADSDDVTEPGDEAALTWLPPGDGLFAYLCKYHGFGQGAALAVGDVDLPDTGDAGDAPVTDDAAGDEPAESAPLPPPVFTVVSHYDLATQDPAALPELDLRWQSVDGDTAGQLNPVLEARVGVPIQLTVRHGDDIGDLTAHALAIYQDGKELAASPEVAAAGDEATLAWTPPGPGAYTYGCPHHPRMGGAISVGLTVVALESIHSGADGFQWKGVGGASDGQTNPTFAVQANETLSIVYRHGTGLSDDQMHNLRIKGPDGETVVDGPDIAAAGDEASVEVTLTRPATYTYECKYHPETQRGTIQVS